MITGLNRGQESANFTRQPWRTLALMTCLACCSHSVAAEQPQPTTDGTPAPSAINDPVATTVQKAVINFTELAEREALNPLPITGPAQAIPFLPLPHDLPVDTDQIIAFDATERAAASHGATPAPCSPTPADTFQALDDPTGQNGPFCGESDCTDGTDNDFDGQIDETTARFPPDTHGAVGPNHVMTVLNTEVRIQNRSGATISTVTLAAFWSSLNNPNTPTPFDPKVLYDPFANRWMFTAMADFVSATSSLLIGVSQSNDPTGNWNLYRYDADPINQVWVDYPSIGFNRDWIAVSVNMFTFGGNFIRPEVYIFNKANLYAGAAVPNLTRWVGTFGDGGTQVPAITYDNNLTTLYLLQSFVGNDVSGFGFLRLYAITGMVNSPTFSAVGFMSTNQRWDPFIDNNSPFGVWDNAGLQCGANQGHPANNGIVANDDRIQNVVFRNGRLWGAQMVSLPPGPAGQLGNPTRTSVQWWEITPSTIPNQVVVQQRARIDDATGNTHFIFPTIAVNAANDALIGYTRLSGTEFASAAYSFRDSNDQTNTFRPGVVFKTGEAPYFKTGGGPLNRWGDYSNTVVDPTNDTDFWTIQQYADAPQGWAVPRLAADRWATQWARVGPAAVPTCPAGFDWAQVSLDSPTGSWLAFHDMAYDSSRNVTVLYVSEVYAVPQTFLTWEWDGCTWVARSPASNPGARVAHRMAFDSTRGKTVLFGGWDTCVNHPVENTYGDTWEYDGSNWTQVSSGGAGEPIPRLGHAMAYDSGRGVTVMFGGLRNLGCDAQVLYNDTWEWNGTQWTQKFPNNNPPPSEGQAAMAYDPVLQKTVLYNGFQTWEWDGTDWTQRFPSTTPSPGSGQDLAFDATRGLIVMALGNFAGAAGMELWEWNGTDWSLRSTNSAVGARFAPQMTYDIARREAVMFEGGTVPSNLLPETFIYPSEARAFCLSGTATGAGWSWCIEGAGFELCDLNVAGVANGSPASALAAQFASSIDAGGCTGVDAAIVSTSPQCFTVSVAGGEDYNLLVGPASQSPNCCMAPASNCLFNPEIFEVVLAGTDCNGNSTDDGIDITGGFSTDINGNGIPDDCEDNVCVGDLNVDGEVEAFDLALLLGSWGPCPGCPADLSGDGVVEAFDLALLLGAWGPCP